ncbi:MAG: peptidylprolyl isomerase [Acidobacteriota bacterium]
MLSAIAAAGAAAACQGKTAPPAPALSADAWAVVDGREIKRDDVEKAYRRMSDASQPLAEEEAMTAKLTLLNDLIVQDILLAKAGELKLELPAAELDTAFADARKNTTDEVFQQELGRRNLTADDLREVLRRELLSQKVVESQIGSKIAVTDQEISDFFNANRARFNIAEEAYHIAQIVVTPVREPRLANRRGDDASTPEAASAKTAMLLERLKAGGSFGELAMDYSEDPESAPRGGDLGLVPVSSLKQAAPPLRDAVLKAPPGTANVVSVGGAHTIVMVVAHELAGQRDLSMPAVRQTITETLRTRREQLMRTAYLTAVRTDAHVVNHLARRLIESPGKLPTLQLTAPGGK